MMSALALLLWSCTASGPTEATARADLERLRPALADIRKQVEVGLDTVSTYQPMDCTDVVEGMREMCQAQAAAQEQASEDQHLAFRKDVVDRITARDDVIALRCFDGERLLGGPREVPGTVSGTLTQDDLVVGWGRFPDRAGLRVGSTAGARRCELYLGT